MGQSIPLSSKKLKAYGITDASKKLVQQFSKNISRRDMIKKRQGGTQLQIIRRAENGMGVRRRQRQQNFAQIPQSWTQDFIGKISARPVRVFQKMSSQGFYKRL